MSKSKKISYAHLRYRRGNIIIIGPLLDDGLKRGTPKALKGLPLSLLFCLCVCLSVCMSVNKLQVTVFDPAT